MAKLPGILMGIKIGAAAGAIMLVAAAAPDSLKSQYSHFSENDEHIFAQIVSRYFIPSYSI